MSVSANYFIQSTALPGNPSIGVFCNSGQPNQDVTVAPDCRTWTSTPPITDGGPFKLAVSPYTFTDETTTDDISASNDTTQSKDWTIIPVDEQNGLYYISSDAQGSKVWTTFGIANNVKIASFTGQPEQVFQFVQQ